MIATCPYGDIQPIKPEQDTPLFKNTAPKNQLEADLQKAREQIRTLLLDRAQLATAHSKLQDEFDEHSTLYCQHVAEMGKRIEVLEYQLKELERAAA